MNQPARPSIKASSLHQQIPGSTTFKWVQTSPWFQMIIVAAIVSLVGLLYVATANPNDSNYKTFAITTLALSAGFAFFAIAYLFFGFWTLQIPFTAQDMPEGLLPKSVQVVDSVVKSLSL